MEEASQGEAPKSSCTCNECRSDLQVITGRMAARLNFDDWLGMIRDQQDKLATIRMCEIVGTRFSQD